MPSSATRTFTDPEMYFAGIRNLQIDGVITKRGEFRAESTRIDLHRLWMHRLDESLPRIMRVTPSGQRSLILFATDPYQPTMQVNGIETSRHQLAMFGLDRPYYLRSSATCGWGTMSLTPEDLAAASEAIIGRPVTPPSFPRSISPPAPVASRLLRLHEAAGHLAKTAPDILAKPEVARAIEEALLEAMILCVTEGQSDQCAQCPSASREGHAASRGGPDVHPRSAAVYAPALRDRWRFLYNTAGLLPGVSRHEPEALFMAAADAPGAPGFAERGCGEDDRNRDRYRLWFLGIGPLCSRLPVIIRRSALGGTASTPRRYNTGPNHRAGVEIR